jgi:serine/threonine protein phosphatase PrpC
MKSLVTCATQTHKSTNNQDFCGIVINEIANFKGVIVADGIGSHLRSELSSKFCTEHLKNKLEQVKNIDDIDFDIFFSQIKDELRLFSQTELTEDELKNNPLGTTLLCAIELEKEYRIAYVGNGSIWQISGNFNHFGVNRYLPWNAINLLNPHTIEVEGKSALFKFISIDDTVSCKPSVISISKNEDSFGDIITITSDGVYTNDEVRIGKDDNDVIWIMGEESIKLLYDKLSVFFNLDLINIEEIDLQSTINEYLSELKERKIMHDDTTLGIIISPKVLKYQQSRLDKLKIKQNEANTDS